MKASFSVSFMPLRGLPRLVKNLPADAGDTKDMGPIPESGRSPGVGNGTTHSSILAWIIPWTEQPGKL